MMVMKDISMHRQWDEEFSIMKHKVTIELEVRVFTGDCFAPLGVIADRHLVPFEQLGIVE